MSKAEDLAIKKYPVSIKELYGHKVDVNLWQRKACVEGYHQAEKDVAEAFARIIRGNLGGIGNGIQYMFEQLYTDITGEKMYQGYKD